MKLLNSVLMAALVLALAACGEKKVSTESNETTVAAADSLQTENADVVVLTKTQMQAVGIETGKVEQKNLTSVVKASGQLAVPPQNRSDVNVLYGGIVRSISVLEGQNVHKGQTLALLENTDFIRLQQDYLSAKRGFSYVSQEYERQQTLKAADAGTGKSYQSAEANFRAESARLQGMEQQLIQVGISPANVANGHISRDVSVKAPITGTVGKIAINTGTFAQPGTPLMDIVDNSKIHADLTVYEKDLSKIHDGQSVRFSLTNQSNQEIFGEIYGVNKSFEGETKGITVHAAIKTNKYGLIPGMYVTALIDVGKQYSPAVPNEAVVQSEGRTFIFIQSDADSSGSAFRKVEVVTGVREGGYTQITAVEDLSADAIIITRGAFYALSQIAGAGEEE